MSFRKSWLAALVAVGATLCACSDPVMAQGRGGGGRGAGGGGGRAGGGGQMQGGGQCGGGGGGSQMSSGGGQSQGTQQSAALQTMRQQMQATQPQQAMMMARQQFQAAQQANFQARQQQQQAAPAIQQQQQAAAQAWQQFVQKQDALLAAQKLAAQQAGGPQVAQQDVPPWQRAPVVRLTAYAVCRTRYARLNSRGVPGSTVSTQTTTYRDPDPAGTRTSSPSAYVTSAAPAARVHPSRTWALASRIRQWVQVGPLASRPRAKSATSRHGTLDTSATRPRTGGTRHTPSARYRRGGAWQPPNGKAEGYARLPSPPQSRGRGEKITPARRGTGPAARSRRPAARHRER